MAAKFKGRAKKKSQNLLISDKAIHVERFSELLQLPVDEELTPT